MIDSHGAPLPLSSAQREPAREFLSCVEREEELRLEQESRFSEREGTDIRYVRQEGIRSQGR
jgi:hypothetical protein